MAERTTTVIYQKAEKRLLDSIGLADYLSLGRCNSVNFATEINARVKIGRRVLYDKNIIDSYLDKQK